jgi:1-pyrroline-5-carboxylate dehydrogenase
MSFTEQGAMRPAAPTNERVRDYALKSAERASLQSALAVMKRDRTDIPLVIGGKAVRTGLLAQATMPHDHQHVLAVSHQAGEREIEAAIAAATRARREWSRTHWSERAAIFLKAADLLAGPWRDTLNAATMLGQSKTAYQAEIDAAAELIDFFRFNVEYMQRIYGEQPISSPGIWNRTDYRPLEGFVFAITPFNFTAIAGNLPTAPALMGNTVVWKPAATAILSAHFVMELLQAAGLPPGVINLVSGDGAGIGTRVISHADLAGVHFTGSTTVFNSIYQSIGNNIGSYRSYPRIVGETGGKNFVIAHASADLDALATAIVRGGYEYQGQKCSAASRIFVPASIWPALKARLMSDIATLRTGDVTDFSNFMGAVIDERAWTVHSKAIDEAKASSSHEILAGGKAHKSIGYFVEPTLIQADDIRSRMLRDELFGPIVTVFVFDDAKFADVLTAIDRGTAYGLTGAIFATDRAVIAQVLDELRDATGNVYVNDKPTGAVVGQQPFGGGRASGTNDKAGSIWNLTRWVSPRSIKENFVPPHNYRYPFMQCG